MGFHVQSGDLRLGIILILRDTLPVCIGVNNLGRAAMGAAIIAP